MHQVAARPRTFALLFGLVLFTLAPDLHASWPRLTGVLPPGGQRGQEMSVVLYGDRLKDIVEVMFYQPGIEALSFAEKKNKRVEATFKISPDCALGEHSLRVRTRSGISELRTFWVGELPLVRETEPNSEFDAAQELTLGVTVNGRIKNEDVDYYAVTARKGQRISAEVEGIRLGLTDFDPYLAILDSERFELAASDDTALLLQDAVVSLLAPEDGKYVIEIRESAYGGSDRCHYRLHVGAFPRPLAVYPPGGKRGDELVLNLVGDAAGSFTQKLELPAWSSGGFPLYAERDGVRSPSPNRLRVTGHDNVLEVEPNNEGKQATATELPLPLAFNGVIQEPGDVDVFKFQAKKGVKYRVRVFARSLRSPLDSVLSIYNEKGGRVANNDDTGGPDSTTDFEAKEDGNFFLAVRDHLGAGGPQYVYRVEFAVPQPYLGLSIPRFGRDSQARQVIPVHRGNRFATVIRANRYAFRGELELKAEGLPEGITFHAEKMAADVNEMPVVFEAAPGAALAGAIAKITAECTDPKLKVRGQLRQNFELVVAPPNRTVYYRRAETGVASAVAEEAPFKIEVQAPKVPLVRNGAIYLKVVARRDEGFEGAINLRMLWKPPGVGAKTTISMAKGKSEAYYPLNANGNATLRTWKIAIQGEANTPIGPVLASSALTELTVAEPYLTMKMDMTVIERGKDGEILCKLDQKLPFEGTAKMTLYGLPAKTTAPPIEITKEAKEVVFKVTTEGKSPVGKHKRLFAQAIVMQDGVPIRHNLGHYGTLRIDPPPKQPKKDVAKAAPKKKPQEKRKAEPKRLSRLEQLRLEAKDTPPDEEANTETSEAKAKATEKAGAGTGSSEEQQ